MTTITEQTATKQTAAKPPAAQAMAEQTRAERRAYLESGLSELACDRCAAAVRVGKHSIPHTSVQWTVRATRTCAEFAAQATPGQPAAVIHGCASLRDSIERAVREGRLDVSTPTRA